MIEFSNSYFGLPLLFGILILLCSLAIFYYFCCRRATQEETNLHGRGPTRDGSSIPALDNGNTLGDIREESSGKEDRETSRNDIPLYNQLNSLNYLHYVEYVV